MGCGLIRSMRRCVSVYKVCKRTKMFELLESTCSCKSCCSLVVVDGGIWARAQIPCQAFRLRVGKSHPKARSSKKYSRPQKPSNPRSPIKRVTPSTGQKGHFDRTGYPTSVSYKQENRMIEKGNPKITVLAENSYNHHRALRLGPWT